MTQLGFKLISLGILLPVVPLLIGERDARASSIESHPLSVSAGIAAPSESLAPFQNPAGLLYNTIPTLSTWAAFDNDSFRNPVAAAGMYGGNTNFGLGGGLQKQIAPDGSASAFAGLSANANGIDTALGVSAQKLISGGDRMTWNAGLLFGTHQKIHVGITAPDFLNSDHGWGAGLSYELAPGISFVTDATLDKNFKNIWLSPGIGFHTPGFGLTASYGLPIQSGSSNSPVIQQGLGAGANLNLNPNFTLFAYYKQLNRYLFGLTLRF